MLNDPANQLLIALTALLFAVLAIGMRLTKQREREQRKIEAEFITILQRAFENKAVATLNDLIALHDAHFEDQGSRVRDYRRILRALQGVQLHIATELAPKPEVISRLAELRELTDLVTKAFLSEEKRVPFNGTSEPERGLLEDLLELTASDKAIVGAKLTRLAELIVARTETMKALSEDQGRAKRMTYWGVVGTVLFGVISIVLALWSRQGKP